MTWTISIAQLAILSNVSYQTAYQWVVSGKVRAVRRCDYPGRGPKHYVIPVTGRVESFSVSRLGQYRSVRGYRTACRKAGLI